MYGEEVYFFWSFLSKFLYDFKLSTVPNIRRIKDVVDSLIKELESGKLSSLKEEEIKSRFVTSFLAISWALIMVMPMHGCYEKKKVVDRWY